MNTLQQAFLEYADKVIPDTAGPVQQAETRQAFYAGALSTFQLVSAFSEQEESVAMQMIDTLDQEINIFFKQ